MSAVQPKRLEIEPYAAGQFQNHWTPKHMLGAGFQAGVLLGSSTGPLAFRAGPTFQFGQLFREEYGIQSRPKNYFIGAEFQLNRQIHPRLWVGGGGVLGVNIFDARQTQLVLEQGVVAGDFRKAALQVQGYAQLSFAPSLKHSLRVFIRPDISFPFFRTYQDVRSLNGFQVGLGLGISWGFKVSN